MLKKLVLTVTAATVLGALGYTAMAVTMVYRADANTVLSFSASDRVPLLPRTLSGWRVESWTSCPVMDRDVNALGQTLRGYGVEGFDRHRVLATAGHLIALGCDLNQRSLTGHTPLHEAILYNEPDVVRFLLAHGADVSVTIEAGNNAVMRFFSGMDSLGFAEALQAKSSHAENRAEIVTLLRGFRTS